MITVDTPIIEAFRSHPLAREVFAKHGMGCVSCMGCVTETIANGAKMHDMDVEALLRELNLLITQQ